VQLRGGNVMRGYWRRAGDAVQNGWLRTGDIGTLDGHGYLYLLDRRSDMIVAGGFNVYPREIELQLLEHPALLDCAVVGVRDDRWGEVAAAAIVVRPGCGWSAEELERWSRERLAGYKIPRSFTVVDELPRNALGKVDKRRLREQLAVPRA
jgi:acyl-CoA synthetase (AMP-forming)/AMP-acid ligase II